MRVQARKKDDDEKRARLVPLSGTVHQDRMLGISWVICAPMRLDIVEIIRLSWYDAEKSCMSLRKADLHISMRGRSLLLPSAPVHVYDCALRRCVFESLRNCSSVRIGACASP